MSKRAAMLISAITMGAGLQVAVATAGESKDSGGSSARSSAAVELQEVVVTARKREESFLDVPVTVNVVTEEQLEQAKIDGLYTLASRIPSLVLGDSVNSIGTQLTLRGVGTMAQNALMDQSVSLDVDGLPLSQSLAYSVATFDVDRVEVFRGPQSLYFGKNSTAGVISLHSNDPTDMVERDVHLGYESEAQEKQIDVILSGPVSNSVKLRLASRYSDSEGFFRNEATAIPGLGGITPAYKNLAPGRNWILRGTALYEPSEKLKARFKVSYNDYKVDAGSPLQAAYCPDGTGPVPPTNIAFMAGDDCKLDRILRSPWFDPAAFPLLDRQIGFESRRQGFASLDLNYKPSNDLTLSSVTGYYDVKLDLLMSGNNVATTQTLAVTNLFENKQFTQEFRLTSSYKDRPVNYMVGAFFLDGGMSNDLNVMGNILLGLPRVSQHPYFELDIRSYSLFGELTWNINQKLELAGGARWVDEKREEREWNYGPAQGPIGPVARPDPEVSSSNVSPEVTLTYKPTDTVTAFASYRTGTKSGSFNGSSFVPSNRLASFNDEKVKGGELGLKTRTHDGRLTASITLYDYKYEDLQVGAYELAENTGGVPAPFLRTLNAAEATVRGVDLDVSYAPAAVNGLTLYAAANFGHARYDSFPNAPCGNAQTIAEGCNLILNPATRLYTAQDLSGKPLVRAPDKSGNIGFSQRIAFQNEMSLTFGGTASYVGEYFVIVPDIPGFTQPSYTKVDANIAISGKNDAWEFALIGRDLSDKITTGYCANTNLQNSVFGGLITGGPTLGPAGRDEASCNTDRGRQLWARLSMRF
jgi:iron complex outermembrane recepter protein